MSNIAKITIVILLILFISILGIVSGALILYIPRIRPKNACNAAGYCSTDIVPHTLLTIEDKLNNISRIYAKRHNIDPLTIKFNVKEGIKSYVEHKRDIYLCVRSKSNVVYSDNTLMEVGVHELAHVISPEWCEDKHSDSFHKLFQELLDIAEQEHYYDPSIPMEHNYCGYNT